MDFRTDMAPEVRLVKLAREFRAGRQDASGDQPDVRADVVRAQVTLVNTGAASYSVTLNNWQTALPGERSSTAPGRGSPASAGSATPPWPPFKYDDFAAFRFGDRLRIDMRWQPSYAAPASPRSAEGWVPMVAGPITDMDFTFQSDGGALLVLNGQDDLSVLTDKNERRYEMNHVAERTIVERVLRRAAFPASEIAAPLVAYPSFARDDGQGLSESLAAGQSYLEYINKIADRLDFEVFLQFADLSDPGSPLEFHFEPSRSRAAPDASLAEIYLLERERDLVSFKPVIKVVDQYTDVVVRGRHRDPQVPEEVRGTAPQSVVSDELHTAASDDALYPAPIVRQQFFPGRQNKFTQPNQSNVDHVRADWYAQVLLRKKARQLMGIEAETAGRPLLRPGRHVEIRGMRSPFDGYYYVTRTVHTLDEQGFRTAVSAARPGMPLPRDLRPS